MNIPTQAPVPVPPLQAGDRLTRDEFERRYDARPPLKKAELIEGVVYLPSPVGHDQHGSPHFKVVTWLGIYSAWTPGVEGGDNSTLRLDLLNEPQPDAFLRILPSHGGRSRNSADGYVEGAVELVAEVAATSASYDLHDKLQVYCRHGIAEYLVWRVHDREMDWFVLREGRYEKQAQGPDGTYASEVFPGLRLDAAALIGGDLARVLQVAQEQLGTAAHAAFVRRLRQAAAPAT